MSVSSFDLDRLNPIHYKNKQDARVRGNMVTLTSDFLDFLRSPEGKTRLRSDSIEGNAALAQFIAIVDDATIVPLIQDDIWDEDDERFASPS